MSGFGIAKLAFTAPLHLSRGFSDNYGESAELFHSDALKSALFAAGMTIIPEAYRNADFFAQFSVSSCFPFQGSRLFLPKPRMPRLSQQLQFPNPENSSNAKKAKRMQYMDLDTWSHLISGGELLVDPAGFDSGGRWYCHEADEKHPTVPAFVHSLEQRVRSVHEGSTEDPKPYFMDRVYFADDAGLYFFFELHNPDFLPVLQRCLEQLGQQGIGSDRSTGNGYFIPQIETEKRYQLNAPDGNAWLSLGLFLPETREALQGCKPEEAMYALVRRGGFMAGSNNPEFQHLRKRTVLMFDAGSTFPSDRIPKGRLADLKPEWEGIHPVWRDGNPLFVKVKLTEA
jgi:CRISPR type III-A-associated RAMP protein Csm4